MTDTPHTPSPPYDDLDAPLPPEFPAEDAPDDIPAEPPLERMGGEPAPDITPEEFARLQSAGQLHLDPRGRVRTTRQESDAGISLRRRRAWYGRQCA